MDLLLFLPRKSYYEENIKYHALTVLYFYSQTNSDGRCPTLLPDGYKAEKGIYRVTFETQAFFSKIGQECFYPYVQVRELNK